jgi:hypothetical protein
MIFFMVENSSYIGRFPYKGFLPDTQGKKHGAKRKELRAVS